MSGVLCQCLECYGGTQSVISESGLFCRHLVYHSCVSLLCITLVYHSCVSLLCITLVYHSCVSLLCAKVMLNH